MSTTETHIYIVTGMTCDHCVSSVQEEVSGIDGVVDVAVDLTSGQLAVIGEQVSEGAVASAVREAGYEVKS